MAEFNFIAKICREMCKNYKDCEKCPFSFYGYCDNPFMDTPDDRIAECEKIAMDYFEKSANRNPTWLELAKQTNCKITDVVPDEVVEKLGVEKVKALAPDPDRCKNCHNGVCNIISVERNEATYCHGLCEHYVDSLSDTQDS